MNALTLSEARRRNRVVILTGPAISVGAVNNLTAAIGRALISRSQRLSAASVITAAISLGAAATVGAMWWHSVSIADTLEAQRAIGRDCLVALPLTIAALARLVSTQAQKGGER